jgi:CheY-like chemotaxis protein
MTKILLVEDDKSLREIYGVRLLAEGYDIVSAGDGEEALAMAIKERPQLVLSDVMMPKISGFDMLDILRSTTETRDIKVIMMTALSSEDQRTRGEALGADRYLVKSQVGIEDVVRTVHDVLGDVPAAAASAPTPNATPTAPQSFSPPAQDNSYRPTPSAPVIPPRPPVQAPAYPSAPQPVATPNPTPQAQSSAPIQSQQPFQQTETTATPSSSAQPEPSSLPQPTAPFSTNRPANLGDRIIHPLTSMQPQTDIGGLMEQELNGSVNTSPTPTPAAAPQQPSPFASSQPFGAQPSQSPGIGFEETPRPSSPFGQGPQAPTV